MSRREVNKMRRYYLLFITLFVLTLNSCVPHTTGETEVGVRTKKIAFWGKKGVEEKVYEPGSTYFFLPFINDWNTFDTKLQNLEFTHDERRGDRTTRDDLVFKTIDGNDISLDMTIAYKIDPSRAYFILQNVAKNDNDLKEKIVRTIARSKPRDIFGELKTEEFYDAKRREAQSQKVKDALQEILAPMGIIVENVYTNDYRFNDKYQQAIEDKKIADQMVEKNKSAQHATEEEYKQKLEDAKGEVNKMVADVNGEFQMAKIEADAYFEKQQFIAEAIKAEGIAEAQGITEMNKAMASAGGEAMVKLKIAEAIQGKKIILLPVSEGGMNLKTTNINELIQTMGVKSLATEEK
jgi:regulator of protease activity HflC (stomatin/prohibitin superfamily)